MLQLTIWIEFEDGSSIGHEKRRLLEVIEELGSIRKAAVATKVSYRQAWILVQSVRDAFDAPVVASTSGGTKGGGTKLTELGKLIVNCFRAIENEASLASVDELSKLAEAARLRTH